MIYAAAGLAQHPGLTQLLLEYGADPNDEETCYHAPETYDNTVVKILLRLRPLQRGSLAWLAARKADWHDEKGLHLALQGGANPNYMTRWKHTFFQHSIRRDNGLVMIEMFLDHGADPYLRTADGRNAIQMAAYHGRGDILPNFASRGFAPATRAPRARSTRWSPPALSPICLRRGLSSPPAQICNRTCSKWADPLLARFAGAANPEGVRSLLDLDLPVDCAMGRGRCILRHHP